MGRWNCSCEALSLFSTLSEYFEPDTDILVFILLGSRTSHQNGIYGRARGALCGCSLGWCWLCLLYSAQQASQTRFERFNIREGERKWRYLALELLSGCQSRQRHADISTLRQGALGRLHL